MSVLTALILAVAILAEVIATTALKLSDGFTRPLPTAAALVGYAFAFYCISLTLRSVPVGIVYAIWSGIGIVLISASGWALFGEKLDVPACLGIALILAGVLVLNLMSGSLRH